MPFAVAYASKVTMSRSHSGRGGSQTWAPQLSLVQSNHAAGLHESDHLRDDPLGLGDVHEDEAGSREIERRPWQAGALRVPVEDLRVRQPAFLEERSSQLDRLVADLHADHGALGPDPLRQELEAALRPAADLDRPSTRPNADLIEEPGRLAAELLGLLPQALLLDGGVAEKVLIAFCRHPRLPRGDLTRVAPSVRAARDTGRRRGSRRQA